MGGPSATGHAPAPMPPPWGTGAFGPSPEPTTTRLHPCPVHETGDAPRDVPGASAWAGPAGDFQRLKVAARAGRTLRGQFYVVARANVTRRDCRGVERTGRYGPLPGHRPANPREGNAIHGGCA